MKKKPGGKKRSRRLVNIDKERAIELAKQGLTDQVIANIMSRETGREIKRRTVNEWVRDVVPTFAVPRQKKVEPEPVVLPVPQPAPQVLLPPTNHPTVDANGRPVRMPGEDELAWRRRWRLWQLETQRAENAAINMETGTPLGWRTPGVREERQRKKIADQLGFNPFEGAETQ